MGAETVLGQGQKARTSEATVGRGWRHWGESAEPGILCACDSRILGAKAWGWCRSPAGKRCLSIDRGLAGAGGGVAPVCPCVRRPAGGWGLRVW